MHLNSNIYFFLKGLFFFFFFLNNDEEHVRFARIGLFLSARTLPLWDMWRIPQPLSPLMRPLVAPVPICLCLPRIHESPASTLASCRAWLRCLGYFVRRPLGKRAQASAAPGSPNLPETFHCGHIPFLLLGSLSPSFSRCPSIKAFLLPQLELPSLVWRQGPGSLSVLWSGSSKPVPYSLSPFSVIQLHHFGHDQRLPHDLFL